MRCKWYNKDLVQCTLREVEEMFEGSSVLEYHPYLIYSAHKYRKQDTLPPPHNGNLGRVKT